MSISSALLKIIEPYFNYSDVSLYHYTKDVDLIFNSGYLKLSPHKKLVEKGHSELQVGSNLIISQLLSDYELHNHVGRFFDYKERGVAVYTFSCCQNTKSNHHLKYGEYCIKLTKDFLNKQKKLHAKQGIPLLVGKVIYEKEHQNELINNIFGSVAKTNHSL